MVLSISWPTWLYNGYAKGKISLHCQSFLQQNQLLLLLPQHLLRIRSLLHLEQLLTHLHLKLADLLAAFG